MCYNWNCLDEQNTEALCFSKPAVFSQLYIVGKAPFMCGLTSSAARLGNGGTHGGLFAMAQRKEPLSEETLTKEWLYQKYHVEKLSMVDIGRIIDRDPKTVLHWMRKYDIPTRPRGDLGNFKGKRVTKRIHSEETKRKISESSKGRKPYLKNGVHHLLGKRGEDVPSWKGGITPERQVLYSRKRWKEAVEEVLKRDNFSCQRCGIDKRTEEGVKANFHVHHIVAFSVKELRCELSNLVLLCRKCHRWVHSKKNINSEFIKEALP